MRKYEIEIVWDGPGKKVVDLIDDAITELFMSDAFAAAAGYAHSAVKYTPRVKQ